MDEVERTKARLAKAIEDGRRVEVFSSMPEFQWFVERVLNPTIEDTTARVMRGDYASEKEDWIHRGIVLGLQMIVDGIDGLKSNATLAKQKAKEYQAQIDEQ